MNDNRIYLPPKHAWYSKTCLPIMIHQRENWLISTWFYKPMKKVCEIPLKTPANLIDDDRRA